MLLLVAFMSFKGKLQEAHTTYKNTLLLHDLFPAVLQIGQQVAPDLTIKI